MAGRPKRAQPLSETQLKVAVALAVAVTSWAMWYGDVVGIFSDAPKLAKTLMDNLMGNAGPERIPYTCASEDGVEDFKMLMELMDKSGANVAGVGLGTFDGTRGLQVCAQLVLAFG